MNINKVIHEQKCLRISIKDIKASYIHFAEGAQADFIKYSYKGLQGMSFHNPKI